MMHGVFPARLDFLEREQNKQSLGHLFVGQVKLGMV
jgi:hypothetical protein